MTARKNHLPARTCLLRLGNDASGATAVEFALTAPIFLALLFGLLEVARALLTQGMLTYAVQEGSRFAVANVSSTEGQIKAVFLDSFVGIDTGPAALTVTPTLNPDGTNTIELKATYNFQPLVPVFGMASILLNASSSSWR